MQAQTDGNLDAVGYVLKQAASALRAAMDSALRPIALTVPQYACLELLEHRPGLSNADLARGAFVSRQSMNGVLRGLQDRDLVTRPRVAAQGRVLPAELTPTGREALRRASAAVQLVELRMLSELTPTRQRRLRADLAACTAALRAGVPSFEPTAR